MWLKLKVNHKQISLYGTKLNCKSVKKILDSKVYVVHDGDHSFFN